MNQKILVWGWKWQRRAEAWVVRRVRHGPERRAHRNSRLEAITVNFVGALGLFMCALGIINQDALWAVMGAALTFIAIMDEG